MAGVAPQVRSITTDERRTVSVDMSGLLDGDELLQGTPSLEHSPSVTAFNPRVSGEELIINDRAVPSGKVALFEVESGSPGHYRIEVLCETTAGQQVEGVINMTVKRSCF